MRSIGTFQVRHQNTAALGTCSASSPSASRCGLQSSINHSLLIPLQKCVAASASTIPVCSILFNTQSLSNKSALMHDFIFDNDPDMLFLTEMWHKEGVFFHLNEASPPGHNYIEKACAHGHGGGIAILHKNSSNYLMFLRLSPLSALFLNVVNLNPVVLVYCPPKSNSSFIAEFFNFITSVSPTLSNILILGDFNLHVDSPKCSMAADFLSYLDSLNRTQHVHGPTHNRGHTLDLIITGNIPISDLNIFDIGDHKAISLSLAIPSSNPPPPTKRVMKYRNLHNLDTPLR